jgi:2-polyprenyl-6-methoxyphenol hydroxylase-like FAD-dependent oxidoreductase
MKNVVIDKWFKDNVFIIGDAAHQFPPSGGYGLNMGITDTFTLAWRLKYMLKENSINIKIVENLKKNYENERITHSSVKNNIV